MIACSEPFEQSRIRGSAYKSLTCSNSDGRASCCERRGITDFGSDSCARDSDLVILTEGICKIAALTSADREESSRDPWSPFRSSFSLK